MAISATRTRVGMVVLLLGLMPVAGRPAPARAGEPRSPIAVVKFEGLAEPGRRVTLDGSGSIGEALRYRWVQTRGTPVQIDDSMGSMAHFDVPADPTVMGFLLVVSNLDGTDTRELAITPGPPPLKAEAGDDLSGLVGRPITLRAKTDATSKPPGYRWLQLSGPTVRLKVEEASVASFVPVEPGTYRFALIVAVDSKISEPDEVVVTVDLPRLPAPIVLSTKDLARQTVTSVPGGLEAAETLARLFEETAGRMDLYESYPYVYSEFSRRLEKVLPADPLQRQQWNDRLFAALSSRIVAGLLAEGLDLRTPEGNRTPMTPSQKSALANQFRAISEGFRSAKGPQ